ncbi:MAG: T9SS type A sorting domain-containing protein [FCB group bacterium]|nr:T9SS type A sorting domain-containing protein [FCB group bacterium]
MKSKYFISTMLAVLVFSFSAAAQDSLAVSKIGSLYDFMGNAVSVISEDDYVYIITEPAGLWIIDFSNFTSPEAVSHLSLDGIVTGIAKSGDYIYLSTGEEGLKIIEVSEVNLPVVVSTFDTPGFANDVTVQGTLALIADASGGVVIVETEDPLNPSQAGQLMGVSNVITLSADLTRLYILDADIGLVIAEYPDISIESMTAIEGLPGSIYVEHETAYISVFGAGIAAFDVSDLSDPVEIGFFTTNCDINGITVVDSVIYSAEMFDGIRSIDFSNPAEPEELDTEVFGDAVFDVYADENVLYAANYNDGVQALDLFDPANLTVVGGFNIPGYLGKLELSGGFAFIADYEFGLRAVDVSAAEFPVPADSLVLDHGISAMGVTGGLVFLGLADNSVQIIDGADPFSLAVLAVVDLPGMPLAMGEQGGYLCTAFTGGFHIYDVSDPASPEMVISLPELGDIRDLVFQGEHAYLISAQNTLFIYDTANPEDPIFVSETQGAATMVTEDIEIMGDYAITSSGDALNVFEVSDPYSPVVETPLLYTGFDAEVSGDHLFTMQSDYLEILEVISFEELNEVGYYRVPGMIEQIEVNGNYLYTVNGYELGIYDCGEALPVAAREVKLAPDGFSLSVPYPNPFNGSAEIGYTLEKSGLVTLMVYDVQGREVTELIRGYQQAGIHGVRFSGQDLASGLYFINLLQGGKSETRRLVLTK